jgi:hypothetical protein
MTRSTYEVMANGVLMRFIFTNGSNRQHREKLKSLQGHILSATERDLINAPAITTTVNFLPNKKHIAAFCAEEKEKKKQVKKPHPAEALSYWAEL